MKRSNNISAARIKLEEFLKAAHRPYTRAELCEALGYSFDHMGRLISKMHATGAIENVTPENKFCGHYVLSYKPKPKDPAIVRVERFVPDQPLNWMPKSPARPGAADHENIPSRRGDGRVKHMPMMLMSSKVTGGVTAT